MDKEQKLKAQQVREEGLKQGGLRPADIVDAFQDDVDGLLPVYKLDNDIKIKVPAWGAPTNVPAGAKEILTLELRYWADTEYVQLSQETFTEWPISEPFPLERTIDKRHFAGREGRFSFRYGVKPWNDSNIGYAADQPITIDRTPIQGQQLSAVEDPGPIDESVLIPEGGVVLTIPDFVEDKKEFVQIAVVWAFSPPPADRPLIPNFTILLPADRKVKVDRAIIEALPSGDHYVVYELFDKAGNRSRPSHVRTVKVTLEGPPSQHRSADHE